MTCDYLSTLSLKLIHVNKEALGMLPRSDLMVFCVPLQVTWKPKSQMTPVAHLRYVGSLWYRYLRFVSFGINICKIYGMFTIYLQRVVIILSFDFLYSYLKCPIQPNRNCRWVIMVTYSVTSLWCVVGIYSLKFCTYSIMKSIRCISMMCACENR